MTLWLSSAPLILASRSLARRGLLEAAGIPIEIEPADIDERVEAYRWTMFAVTELEQPLWRITRHSFVYPPDKRLPADIELARDDFAAMAAILEKHLEGREFIVGNRLTVADCVTVYLIDWANECHLIDAFPRLQSYLERLYARPEAPQRIADARKAA